MASVDSFRGSSLWPAGAVGEDVGMGGLYGFQGLRLSEAAVADKEGRLVKGRSDDKEEEKELVTVAPSTSGIKGKAVEDYINTVSVAGGAVEEALVKGKRLIQLTEDDITWILDQKPGNIGPPPDKETVLKEYPPKMIDKVMENELRLAKAMASVQKMFFAFQDRVRKDFEETGVVMVEDLSEEVNESDEEFHCEFSSCGNYSDIYASTHDEEQEDGEVAPESTSN